MKRPAPGAQSPARPSQPAEKPATPDWARGAALALDGPLAALLGLPRWCCWAWFPSYRKRDGVWVWTKKPLGAPKGGSEPWALAVNRSDKQGRAYALAQGAVLAGNADGVGWLMQAEWLLVWLDLDKCRDPVTGIIDAWAQAIIDQAGGCYAELTPSGTGVRLCGRASRLDVPMQGRWKPPGGAAEGVHERAQVEIFYACARFVTVTGRVLEGHEHGDIDADLSDLAFELRQLGEAQEPARGNKSGVRRVASVPSDKTAPIEDVVSALEVIPNGENVGWEEFNRVGMAVWAATEGSPEGLEAWMTWSMKFEGHRDEECEERWAHYFTSPPTDIGFGALVLLAQAASPGWRRPSRRPEAEFEPEDPGDGEPERHPFLRLLDRVVLVLHPRRYYDEVTCLLLDDDQLKVVASELGVGGFAIGGQKGVSARLQRHHALRRADRLTMRPGQGKMVEEDGRPALNIWRPSKLVPSDADAGPWVRHMDALIPDAAERALVLDRMAFLLQRQGVKINSGLLLLGEQGDGKDTGLEPLIRALGSHNVSIMSGSKMDSQFNPYLKRQLLLISEVPSWHRKSFYEDTKHWVTSPPTEFTINEKLTPTYQIPNIINVIATTNHDDALALPPGERRWFVVRTRAVGGPAESQEKSAYYDALYRWFEAGGAEAVAGWLLRRDVSAFKPMADPAMTGSKQEMIRQGSSPAMAWACGLWADGGALEGRQLLTVEEVWTYAQPPYGAGDAVKRSLTDKQIELALKHDGWRSLTTRLPVPKSRPRVWTRSGALELLSKLSPRKLLERLEAERGAARESDWGEGQAQD